MKLLSWLSLYYDTNKDGEHFMVSNRIALQVRFDESTHSKLKQISELELRSLNAQIEYFVIKGIQKYENDNGPLDEQK